MSPNQPSSDDIDWDDLAEILSKSFSLHPIKDPSLFAGRTEQRRDLVIAMNQDGLHPIIYGERGVGKTSLANIAVERNRKVPNNATVEINCDSGDTFGTLWKKAFDRVTDSNQQEYSYHLDENPNPEDVRRVIEEIVRDRSLLVVIDEFDSCPREVAKRVADTIKTLYDHAVRVKVILVGIADDVGGLIESHASITRALSEILMPRMTFKETTEIITSNLHRAGMSIETAAAESISTLSQGLPHYAQLLGLHAGLGAIDRRSMQVEMTDTDRAIAAAVQKASETIKRLHHKATMSPRKDNLFKQALLACALCKTDDRGYFGAADVRGPFSRIMNKESDIQAFSQHLEAFISPERGPVLNRIGKPRSWKFRFAEPLLQPYVIMQGLATGLITRDRLSYIQDG